MADLIDLDALLKDLRSDCPESDVCIAETSCIECIIGIQPTIEAESARHGRWKKKNGEIYCTNCKKSKWSESFELMLRRFNYCPYCGARMGK